MSEFIFKLPDLGEGTVESEIGEWFIKVGDHVAEEDVVGTMMTDKAAVELSSPVSGTVVKLAGEPGDIVAVGAALVVIDTDGGDVAAPATASTDAKPEAKKEPAAKTEPVVTEVAAAAESQERLRVMASPAIRRRAKEADIDLSLVPGSGPGGRILRKDFDGFLKARATGQAFTTTSTPSTNVKEIKIIGLRRMIAERMSAAKRDIPHFAYVEEIDITELESLRKHLNDGKDASQRLTLLPFLGLALVKALREFPQCNVTHDKDRNVLLQHDAVHLGVATQTPDGLKVPVIKHAEMRSLDDLAAEIRRVSIAARDNSAKKSELSGSTITITSLGKLGGIVSTPVINSPEVAIIGVNKAVERPVVFNGQVAVRLMMNLSSSFDHRFVDGYDAAAMIQRIREMLEHPATIFLPG
ncbi:MAG: 2-oxo acid dehydrogenase subunit E2 [Gammaproteobacteria bacterium]|nr:2-oxo acid dehydrogenase subunit E2 [Gammaproteobacteria bacterium]MBU2676404.1 2-oxo acid dehydrogenase subunit E2 [Gammaproteobacteria bacterium]NNC57506.1 2-oxo acid dehydrogenase subunit E2 [Woeseiaceae bacterium]NNL50139.1 2-oxo acid dehydrogenase subunit E2 [Woeseiaceae bacterium]